MADEGGPLLYEEGNYALFLLNEGIDAGGLDIEEIGYGYLFCGGGYQRGEIPYEIPVCPGHFRPKC